MKLQTIVGTGLVTLDVIFRGDSNVPLRSAAGGTCGNVLTILSYLGWHSVPVARLEEDLAGERVATDLNRWGVDTQFLQMEPRAPTPIIVERIRHTSKGVVHSFLFTCPCCGAMLPRYRPIRIPEGEAVTTAIPKPAVFFFDRPSPAAIRMASTYAAAGVLVAFEPSALGDRNSFDAAIDASHIVKYSEQRLAGLPVHKCKHRRLEIQTRGADGLRYRVSDARRAGAWLSLPAFSVGDVLDTAGAGDWSTAGLLFQLAGRHVDRLDEAEIENALRYGQALSAWNCRFEGARGGMFERSAKEMAREVDSILAGTTLSAEPEHVDLGSAHSPSAICPACDGKTKRAKKAV